MSGFLDRNSKLFNSDFKISDTLKNISNIGLKYNDMIMKNSQAIGNFEDMVGLSPEVNPFGLSDESIMGAYRAIQLQDTTQRKAISFFDKSYIERRNMLRKFALNDEVEEILDIICDESIVYDNRNFFCQPSLYKLDVNDDVKEEMTNVFHEVYNKFGFNTDISAWQLFRKWLIDGFLAFEIIYNDKQDEIIAFKELDATTLVPGVDDDGKKIWIQHMDDHVKKRVLYDSQIIYISYASVTTQSRVSYVERLIRSFNLLRIMEHTRIIWAVMNSSYKMKFIIPVSGGKSRAQQSLAQLRNAYNEQIDFNYDSGELNIDGKSMLQFRKNYWIPSKDGESPEIETIGGEGPDISDTEALRYFYDKLKTVSKVPFSRFQREDGRGDYSMSADGILREEIKFQKFISRLYSSFQEILVKPIYLQMLLKYPEFKEDIKFKNEVGIDFNKETMFSELKEIEINNQRVDFINNMKDSLVEMDEDMNEIPFFPLEYLIEKYLKLPADELLKIKRLKEKAKEGKEDGGDELSDFEL